jgi:hypothetical protein
MKLWLLFDTDSYEGDTLHAVCTTLEIAQAIMARETSWSRFVIRECETNRYYEYDLHRDHTDN